MTDDEAAKSDANPRGHADMIRRGRALFVLVAVLLMATATIALAAVTTYPVGSGATFETDSGLTIEVGQDINQPTGNPFTTRTVQLSDDSLTLAGESGGAVVGAVNASVTSGYWTNLSQINAQSGPLIVNRSDTNPVGTRGTTDALRVSNIDFAKSNDRPELRVTAGGPWTLQIRNSGLQQGQGVVLRDPQTGEVLRATAVASNGSVRFEDVSSVNQELLNVERGPSVLRIFNASQPTQLADGVTLRARVFDQDGQVFERDVQNGQLQLTGIPKNEPLTITIAENNSTQYIYRRTVIESVSEQQEAYLLSSANTAITNVVFTLDDRTGRFNAEDTILYVKRPVTKDFDGDGSNETRYQNVVGDTFGVGSFPTILEVNQRYRLVVQNEQGDQRVIGSYVAQVDDRVTVRIGNVEFRADTDRTVAASLRAFQENVSGGPAPENFTRFSYLDPERQTESISWNITNQQTGRSHSGSATGPFGRYVVTVPVSNSTTNHSWTVEWDAVREQDDGTDRTISGTDSAGSVADVPLPVDARWLSLIGYVAVVAIAGLVVQADAVLGALAATGAASVLTALGIITVPVPALALGGAISFVALIGRSQR